MNAVLVMVRDGVAEYAVTGDVKVVMVDYDNLQDDDTSLAVVTEVAKEVEALPEGDEDWDALRNKILGELGYWTDVFDNK